MKPYQIFIQGFREPLDVELESNNIEDVADRIASTRFLVGQLADTNTAEAQPKILIPAGKVSCIIEML